MAYVQTHIDKDTGYADYVCETVADLSAIPHKDLLFGCFAYVLATKKVYIMNNNGEWEEQ